MKKFTHTHTHTSARAKRVFFSFNFRFLYYFFCVCYYSFPNTQHALIHSTKHRVLFSSSSSPSSSSSFIIIIIIVVFYIKIRTDDLSFSGLFFLLRAVPSYFFKFLVVVVVVAVRCVLFCSIDNNRSVKLTQKIHTQYYFNNNKSIIRTEYTPK